MREPTEWDENPRVTRTVVGQSLIASLAMTLIIGCTARPYSLECVGPGAGLASAECDEVAEHVVAQIDFSRVQIGKLMVVSVEPTDCEREGRAILRPEIYGPEIDRCWRAQLTFAGGVLGRLIAHNEMSDTFLVVE